MDDYMWITFPNEGEIAVNIRNMVHWGITNVRVIGDSVFFDAMNGTFSARFNEFEKYFPKLLHN